MIFSKSNNYLITILNKSIELIEGKNKSYFSIDSPYGFLNSIRKSEGFKNSDNLSIYEAWADKLSQAIIIKDKAIPQKPNFYPNMYKSFILYLSSQSDMKEAFLALSKTNYFKYLVNDNGEKDKYTFLTEIVLEASKFGVYENIESALNVSSPPASIFLKRHLLRKTTINKVLFLDGVFYAIMKTNLLNEKEQIKYLTKALTIWPKKEFAQKYLLELELANPINSNPIKPKMKI